MAGEIATAYISLVPSMKGFGSEAARQIGPQATAVGRQAGQQAGAAFTSAAAKESENWFGHTAKAALKNVALYGSMYAIITNVQRGLGATLDAMIGFNAELEQANIGFETLLGSASAAESQMQWIKDFARETPFQYKDLVGYSQTLLALGFNAEEAKNVLQATGDAAAALGRGSESIARINLALGQMWTKGKVQSQEMLQLTEAGIGGWQILAEAYGTTVENVQEAVTAGLIKASDAVPALLEGMNARFGGLMEKQAQTFSGTLSNVQDTLQQQLAEAGEPLFDVLTVEAKKFLESLDDPEVVAMMQDLGEALADGARFLADAGEFAWEFRDAIIAVGIAIAASQLLLKVPVQSLMSPATWTSALGPLKAYRAGVETLGGVLAPLRGAGQVAGLFAAIDGYQRVSEAAHEGDMSVAGFAESMAGGAIAGAAFGSIIPGVGTAVGAVTGAVVGLASSVWAYQAAQNAANADTSLAQQALSAYGVEANLAALALAGVTNAQLEAAGGVQDILAAMKEGTFPEYVAGLEKQSAALHEQADAAYAAWDAREKLLASQGVNTQNDDELYAMGEAYNAVKREAEELDTLLGNLRGNSDAWTAANDAVVASNYQAAFALDMQTGALGSMTEAAWNAVVAEGGLGNEALTAALRMEGLAGMAGYATQMITGIPANTPINFSTNAVDIWQKIAALKALTSGQGANSYMGALDGTIAALEKQYTDALKSTAVTLQLPTAPKTAKGGGGKAAAAKAAAEAAARAAEEAARKLERDRTVQLRFADAFGAIMESALEGNFDQYRDRLQDQITSLTRDGYTVAANKLKQMSVALTQATIDYSALTNKLHAASDAYDELTGKMQDQYDTSRNLILGLGKATDAQSFDQLAYLLGETTTRALDYQAVLAQLKDQGLSDDLWNQLAQAGPESMGLAQSILTQGQAGIDQLNSLSGGLLDAADSMGTLVSQSMYQQGVNAMQAYIDGLKSQSSALEAQLETIANNVLTNTAGAITPGNAGYTPISAAPQQVVNQYSVSVTAESLGDIQSVQQFIAMLEQAATTELVNQAGTVTS